MQPLGETAHSEQNLSELSSETVTSNKSHYGGILKNKEELAMQKCVPERTASSETAGRPQMNADMCTGVGGGVGRSILSTHRCSLAPASRFLTFLMHPSQYSPNFSSVDHLVETILRQYLCLLPQLQWNV